MYEMIGGVRAGELERHVTRGATKRANRLPSMVESIQAWLQRLSSI